jgi:RNA polymerase subunit RPABC4/transcription elongation factor Spt4
VCPKCDRWLGPGAKICPFCGTKESSIEEKKFLNKLESSYRDLASRSIIAPMVKISDLRKAVMEDLKISREEFDRMIVDLHYRDPYMVQFFTGVGPKEEGIETWRGVFQYALIKEKPGL